MCDLEIDPLRCRNRLDWAAKLALIREFQSAQNLGANDPWLQSLDLEYHRLDRDKGLYYALEQSGSIIGAPDDAAVRRAISDPPRSTRAYIRGRCIQKFAPSVIAAQWDHITLQGRSGAAQSLLAGRFHSLTRSRLTPRSWTPPKPRMTWPPSPCPPTTSSREVSRKVGEFDAFRRDSSLKTSGFCPANSA